MRLSLSLSLSLAILPLVLAGTAAAGGPAMPRVVHTFSFPPREGGSTSIFHLNVNGRIAAYVLGEFFCASEAECSQAYTVTQYDGVSPVDVFTSTQFILDMKLSSDLLVWDQPTYIDVLASYGLWAAGRDDVAKLLTESSLSHSYDVSGKHVIWGQFDEDTFGYDIFLDGKNITQRPEPNPAFLGRPEMSGNTLIFPAQGPSEQVALRRGSRKYLTLPPLRDDQMLTDLELAENGDKVVQLKRDFFDDGQTHHELSIYDVPRKRTLTIPLENAPLEGIPYQGGRYYVWNQGQPFVAGGHLQVTDLETGATEDINDRLGADNVEISGNVSDGLLSYELVGEGPRLYDIETGVIETISYSGGDHGVANSGRNVAWVDYGPGSISAVWHISYPADEAVSAIDDAVKRYGLRGSAQTRLRKPLKAALRGLDRGDWTSAEQALHQFVDSVAALQDGSLSEERAAALGSAAERVIDALHT